LFKILLTLSHWNIFNQKMSLSSANLNQKLLIILNVSQEYAKRFKSYIILTNYYPNRSRAHANEYTFNVMNSKMNIKH
jgi:hypothetical protein